MTWEALGGLPGMLLTMAQTGHGGSLKLHGTSALPRLVDSFHHFVPKYAMPHSTHPVQTGQTITLEESGIAATPLVLRAGADCPGLDSAAGAERDALFASEDEAEGGAEGAPKRQRVADAVDLSADAAEGLVPGGGGGRTAVCWLLQMPDVPPKFDAGAADELQAQ